MKYIKEEFNIIPCGDYQTITNPKGKYENHCHVNTRDTADMLVRLMRNKRVPKSNYLRQCVLRVSLDERYLYEVKYKIKNNPRR